MIKNLIFKHFTNKLHGKHIVWTKYFKVFCDGGCPKWGYLPHYRKNNYHKYWGLWGFAIYWLGREFNFCFGEDKNGLYKRSETLDS